MPDSISLVGLVKDGSPDLSGDQMERLLKFYQRHPDKWVTITVSIKGKPRSLRQNAYYHGVVVKMISDETGHDSEELHEILKQKFLPREFIVFGGEQVQIAKSTKKLSTAEFNEYVDRIVAFAGTELNLSIPPPVS